MGTTMEVRKYKNRALLGRDAGREVAAAIRDLLSSGNETEVNMVFAAAPSQQEFLETLVEEKDIDWSRVNAFHMDEYIGLSPDAPQRFGNFLTERLFGKVSFRTVHYLNGSAPDLQAECDRYGALLRSFPTDIVCMGIGENNHIAFNDPHVADFGDPQWVKVVTLDAACRRQQVNDGCFEKLDYVPTQALTLTVPALMAGDAIYCMVPGSNKAQAVRNTLLEDVDEQFPSTILRTHPKAMLFVDRDSARLLPNGGSNLPK